MQPPVVKPPGQAFAEWLRLFTTGDALVNAARNFYANRNVTTGLALVTAAYNFYAATQAPAVQQYMGVAWAALQGAVNAVMAEIAVVRALARL